MSKPRGQADSLARPLPRGIAECFSYIVNTYKTVSGEVVVVATSSPNVDRAYNALLEIFSKCVRPRFGTVAIERVNISSDDIYSSEDLWELMEKVEVKTEKGDFVDVTGGQEGDVYCPSSSSH